MTKVTSKLKMRDAREGLWDGFVGLAEELYEGDPLWVPESRAAIEAQFSAKNRYFEGAEGAVFLWPGEVRCAVFFDGAAKVEGEAVAFFGFYESRGNERVERELFEAMEAWARARGAKRLVGPVEFGTFGRNRFRLEVLDDGVPFLGEPYQRAEYPEQLRRLGYEACSRAVTQVQKAETMGKVWRSRLEVLEGVEAMGFELKALTPEVWLENLRELHGVVNRIFAENYGFSPLSWALFEQVCNRRYIERTDPECSVVAVEPDGGIAGFFLVYPHWGPLVVQGAGVARVESGEISFGRHFEVLRAMGSVGGVFKTGAVAPEYRRNGLFNALTIWSFRAGEGRYDRWYGALVREDNPSRRYAGRVSEDCRFYALFSKRLFSV